MSVFKKNRANLATRISKGVKNSNSSTVENKSSKHVTIQENAKEALTSRRLSHEITMKLLEGDISEEYVQMVRYITHEQYQDVIDERSLADLCGYMLCNGELDHCYKNQTYIIRNNTVFNVVERKKCCSDKCYEASEIIREQISSVPLYLRASDREITNQKIIIPNHHRLRGRKGLHVPLSDHPDMQEAGIKENKNKKMKTTSPSQLATKILKDEKCKRSEVSFNNYDSINHDLDLHENKSNADLSELSDFRKDMLDIITSNNVEISKFLKNQEEQDENSCQTDDSKSLQWKNAECDDEKSEKMTKKARYARTYSPLQPIEEVEKVFREWMTFKSLRIILGDVYVRGMLEHMGENFSDYDSTDGLHLSIEAKSKYLQLCRKLHQQEIEDDLGADDDEDMIMDEDVHDSKFKVTGMVPDYEQLKEDTFQKSLKINAFLQGKEEYEIEEDDGLETIRENEEETLVKANNENTRVNKITNDDCTFLSRPFHDASKLSWRRQIFHEKLDNVMSELSTDLGLCPSEIRLVVKPLVASFDLGSNNIMLKPFQWKLVAAILIKMLGIRVPAITEALGNQESYKHLCSFFVSTGLDYQYLDRLISFLTEVPYLLKKCYNRKDTSYPYDDRGMEESTNVPEIKTLPSKIDEPADVLVDEFKNVTLSDHSTAMEELD